MAWVLGRLTREVLTGAHRGGIRGGWGRVQGSDCPFSHDATPNKKDDVCRYLIAGRCAKGDACPFSHDIQPAETGRGAEVMGRGGEGEEGRERRGGNGNAG